MYYQLDMPPVLQARDERVRPHYVIDCDVQLLASCTQYEHTMRRSSQSISQDTAALHPRHACVSESSLPPQDNSNFFLSGSQDPLLFYPRHFLTIIFPLISSILSIICVQRLVPLGLSGQGQFPGPLQEGLPPRRQHLQGHRHQGAIPGGIWFQPTSNTVETKIFFLLVAPSGPLDLLA
jgi:hypothetical protein